MHLINLRILFWRKQKWLFTHWHLLLVALQEEKLQNLHKREQLYEDCQEDLIETQSYIIVIEVCD